MYFGFKSQILLTGFRIQAEKSVASIFFFCDYNILMICILVSVFPLDCQLKKTERMGNGLRGVVVKKKKKPSPPCMYLYAFALSLIKQQNVRKLDLIPAEIISLPFGCWASAC